YGPARLQTPRASAHRRPCTSRPAAAAAAVRLLRSTKVRRGAETAGKARRTSAQIDRIFLQELKGHDLQRSLVRPRQTHPRRLAGAERLLPARRAETPAIARLQPGKPDLRHRGRQIVAGSFGKRQELGIDAGAHGVNADILGPGLATAGAVEAGQ